jgi:hypothetical protein
LIIDSLKSVVSFVVTMGAAVLLASCGDDNDQGSVVNAQVVEYVSPIDYDIVLAGNFGEPRPWHFHGGLDIKTGNVEGKKVFSIAEGYVSRNGDICAIVCYRCTQFTVCSDIVVVCPSCHRAQQSSQ